MLVTSDCRKGADATRLIRDSVTVFQRIDVSTDNYLDLSELRQSPSRMKAGDVLRRFDADKDGTVSMEDWAWTFRALLDLEGPRTAAAFLAEFVRKH